MKANLRSQLDEHFLKARCIDYLLARHDSLDDEYVIVNEFRFADGGRRADIVEVNGFMHAYEVKSDVDNLDRLEAQLCDYLLCFDTVTVVATAKHLSRIIEMVPSEVGILSIDRQKCTLLRSPANALIFSDFYLASMLDMSEIDNVLREKCVPGRSRFTVYEKREAVCKLLSCDELKALAIKCIKKRNFPAFNSFLNFRGQRTLVDDLKLFSNTTTCLS